MFNTCALVSVNYYTSVIFGSALTDSSTVDLHLSGIIWTPSHPDVQKIRLIGFFFENSLQLAVGNFGCYYIQHVPSSKP
jgi:hypothetical protein